MRWCHSYTYFTNQWGTGGTGTCVIEYSSSIDGGTTWTAYSTTVPTLTATGTDNRIRMRTNCSGTGCDLSAATVYTWNVVPDPAAPTATKSPNVMTVCTGAPLTLSGVVSGSGGTGTCNVEYAYSLDGGTTYTPYSTTLPLINATGTDNRIKIRMNCSGIACDVSPESVYTWNVVPDPSAPTATKSPNTSAVCSGDTLTLTSPISGAGGTGTCNIEYAFSVDAGVTYSAWSTTIPAFASSGTDNRIKMRTNCSGLSCDISPETVYSWNVRTSPSITSVVGTNPLCSGDSSGTITINATGGTPPLRYSITNGLTYSSIPSFTSLSAGSYQIVVTDTISCTTRYFLNPLILNNPAPIVLIAEPFSASCSGVFDGSIFASASGGTGTYQYSLNGGPLQPFGSFSGLSANTYVVWVYDGNNCFDSATVTVTNTYVLRDSLLSNISASCFGASDAQLSIVALGGVSPYQYSRDGSFYSASNVFSGLSAGSYTLFSRDSRGCTSTRLVTVTQPSALTITQDSVRNNACFGDSLASVYLSVSGGRTPYSYLWNDGSSSLDRTGLTAGSYSLTVTDSAGLCSQTYSVTITSPSQLIVALAGTLDVTCYNRTNGLIDVSVYGGTPTYSFAWSNGTNSEDLINVSSGIYSVTVTDANNCSKIVRDTITQPNPLGFSVLIDSVNCFGGIDGSIDVSISGGTTPYAYAWSNGANTQDLSALSSGTYTLTITDRNGCDTTLFAQVYQPNRLNLTAVVNNVTCYGANNGSINLTVNGGRTPYNFTWNDAITTEDRIGVGPGTYSVVVSDANACRDSLSNVITQPDSFTVISVVTNTTCSGVNNGSINITVSGATSPYTYNWGSGVTTEDRTGLAAGNYTVTITDANSCTKIVSYTITSPSALSSSKVVTNVTCFGGSNGSIDLSVSGGTTPYTYLWNTFANTQDISGLNAGLYTVIVTDNNGCILRDTALISQPARINVSGMINNVSCYGTPGGFINLTVSGGSLPYNFVWNDGATTEDRIGVGAGAYSVLVTDANACRDSASYVITQPDSFTVISSVSNTTCSGVSDGSINITVSGATSPYTYNWGSGIISEDRTGLAGGTYSVTITDARSCTKVLFFTVNSPAALSSSKLVSNVTCFGGNNGSVDLSVSGGTAPYVYLWNTFVNTQDLSGLTAGLYTVIITDNNGCTRRDTASVSQPGRLNIALRKGDANCYGDTSGFIDVTVSGGITPYSYSWNDGFTTEDRVSIGTGVYLVRVIDFNGCADSNGTFIDQPDSFIVSSSFTNVTCAGLSNGTINLTVSGATAPYIYIWNDGASTEDRTGLGSGTYTVTITDNNGCTKSLSFNITSPSPLTSNKLSTNVTCFGGSNGAIDLTVSGGTVPYTYLWNTFANTQDLTGLNAGLYTVIITDANGCTARDTALITQPSRINIASVITNVNCYGASTGAINLTLSGGRTPYSFTWSDGSGTEDRIGLRAGSYSVIVTDANSCRDSAAYNITQPDSLIVISTLDNVSCFGFADGRIQLNVSGGSSPYTYLWNDGAITEDRNAIVAGTFSVTITDRLSCTKVLSFNITSPTAISSSKAVTQVSCFGGNNGAIDLSVSGGTTPYSYLWNTFANTQDLTGLNAGLYTVIITDANGCSIRDTTLITQPARISITGTIVNNVCFGGSSGSINVTVSGGTPAYTYRWNDLVTTEDRSGLLSGTYTITVTDSRTCRDSNSFVISNPAPLSIIAVVTSVRCNRDSTGFIDVTVSGGTAPYSYNWGSGITTQDRNRVYAGTYTVTVTDANACTATASYTITEPAPLAYTVSTYSVTCPGGSDGSLRIRSTGGVGPYTYFWSSFALGDSLRLLPAGPLSVLITDFNGCQLIGNATIVTPAPINVNFNVNDARCYGYTDGFITTGVTGGTAGYSYLWSTGATSTSIASLGAGTYRLTVTDSRGCQKIDSAKVNQPDTITITSVVRDVNCYGENSGAIDITAAGGNPPYAYNWTGPGGITLTTEDVDSAIAGYYYVVVNDRFNCGGADSILVRQPDSLAISANLDSITCFGSGDGSIDIDVNGGVAPYRFVWSTGSTSEDINRLNGGTYSVTVTDAHLCALPRSWTLTEPAPLTVALSPVSILCAGANTGSVSALVSGGTAPYRLLWSTFDTSTSLSGLAAGTYSVSVTDSRGCTAFGTTIISEPTRITLAAIITPVKCFGGSNGEVDINLFGGFTPYSFLWSTGVITEDLTSVGAGTYSLIVTDGAGCTVTDSFEITQPDSIILGSSSIDPNCSSGSSGFAEVNVRGGVPGYTYLWSTIPAQTERIVSGLSAGTYTVTVSDSNACTASTSVIINNPSGIIITLTPSPTSCSRSADGVIRVSVSGGRAPYTYQLDGKVQTDSVFTGLEEGTYTVLVTDANGCVASATTSISSPSGFSVTLTAIDPVISRGQTVLLSLTNDSPLPLDTVIWGPSYATFDFGRCGLPYNCAEVISQPDTNTCFFAIAQNTAGCQASDSVCVIVRYDQPIFVPTVFSPNGDGLNATFDFMILGAQSVDVTVRDRYGELVYANPSQTNGAGKGWDGTFKGQPAPMGTYVYQFVITYFDGTKRTESGDITLIR